VNAGKSVNRGLGTLSWALAFVGVLSIVSPIADWLLTNLPLEVSQLTWRYQALGRLSQSLLTPILGMTLVVGAGALSRRTWLCRVGGWLALGGALAVLALTGVFLLDMMGARQQVLPEAAGIFRIGAIRASIKFVLSTIALGLLGWAGLSLAASSEIPEGKRQVGPAVPRLHGLQALLTSSAPTMRRNILHPGAAKPEVRDPRDRGGRRFARGDGPRDHVGEHRRPQLPRVRRPHSGCATSSPTSRTARTPGPTVTPAAFPRCGSSSPRR
jgi:hypothetical protein